MTGGFHGISFKVLCYNCSTEDEEVLMEWYWTSKDGLYMHFSCRHCTGKTKIKHVDDIRDYKVTPAKKKTLKEELADVIVAINRIEEMI